MSVSEKKRIGYNVGRVRRERSSSNELPLWFVTVLCALVLTSFGVGLVVGWQNSVPISENKSISTGNFNFHFVTEEENSKMEGRHGFTLRGNSEDVWIDRELVENRRVNRLKTVCQHEVLHNLGLTGGEAHEFVYRYDSQIDEPVCNDLIDKLF